MQAMPDENGREAEPLDDNADEIDLYDPWARELAFEKARPLPVPADLSQDLPDTIH